jgi:hypothetical protein
MIADATNIRVHTFSRMSGKRVMCSNTWVEGAESPLTSGELWAINTTPDKDSPPLKMLNPEWRGRACDKSAMPARPLFFRSDPMKNPQIPSDPTADGKGIPPYITPVRVVSVEALFAKSAGASQK